MTSYGSAHPLDVDLADLVDGVADPLRAGQLDAHLADCLLCRIKVLRLSGAPPPGATPPGERGPLPSPIFTVPTVEHGREPVAGELWLAGGDDERILVLVVRAAGGRALVAPVTLDAETADEEAVVVDDHSPFPTGIAVHPVLATELPQAVLAGRVATLVTPAQLPALLGRAGGVAVTGAGGVAVTGTSGIAVTGASGIAVTGASGIAVTGADDPRLQVRQALADRLASLDDTEPGPAEVDAPPTRPEQVRSALIADLRALRGDACVVRPLDAWGDLVLAAGNGWVPLVTLDELGVVLVVFDTPHGLVDDRDFDAARSVLTRLNATALVVLTRELSDLAEVFDASSLNAGIDMPSGAHTAPRPLIYGLVAFDAIAKFLDQHSGARAMSPPTRGPVARVDVGDILGQAAAAAVADTVRQGGRFKIAPKRHGYESLAGDSDSLGAALAAAFSTEGSVVEALQDLAREPNLGDDAE